MFAFVKYNDNETDIVHVSRIKNFNHKDFNPNNNRKQYRVMWKDDQYYDAFIVQIGGKF